MCVCVLSLNVHCWCAGIKGFGQGLLARTMTIAPGAAIQWFIYEHIKAVLARASAQMLLTDLP